jgi:hypothetical protein
MSEIKIEQLFPLFHELLDKSKNMESHMNWAVTSHKLNTLTEKEMEIVYVLIVCYYFMENKAFLDKKKMTPYKGKLMDGNKGIIYTITDLPLRLQQMIYEYIQIIRS